MPDRAITLYRKALTIEPTHQNALFNLGVVYGYDRKDYAKAINYWERLLQVSPNHPKADYLQATMAQFKKAMKQRAN
jgi:tetratricopeptide (TPR) repeat protein